MTIANHLETCDLIINCRQSAEAVISQVEFSRLKNKCSIINTTCSRAAFDLELLLQQTGIAITQPDEIDKPTTISFKKLQNKTINIISDRCFEAYRDEGVEFDLEVYSFIKKTSTEWKWRGHSIILAG